jgi:hypothetical protein
LVCWFEERCRWKAADDRRRSPSHTARRQPQRNHRPQRAARSPGR